MMEVLNKIDLLEPGARSGLLARNSKVGPVAISALSGEGVPDFLNRVELELSESETVFRLKLAPSDGEGMAWAYAHGRVSARKDRADGPVLTVSVDQQSIDRFIHRFGDKIKQEHAVKRAS